MAPKCHRVTRRVGFQQATQLLSHIHYPTDTRQLTSPQGEADVRSLEGVWRRRHWGGLIHLAVDTTSKGSPPLLEVRHTHAHATMLVGLLDEHHSSEGIHNKINLLQSSLVFFFPACWPAWIKCSVRSPCATNSPTNKLYPSILITWNLPSKSCTSSVDLTFSSCAFFFLLPLKSLICLLIWPRWTLNSSWSAFNISIL